jgi:hypothetical protein
MNRFFVVLLSASLLMSPAHSADEQPLSEEQVEATVFSGGFGGFSLGFFSLLYWVSKSYPDESMFFKMTGISIAVGTAVGALLGYYFASEKTVPALYKKAVAHIPLTNHTKGLLKLAELIEAGGVDAFLNRLETKYQGSTVRAFNDYVDYRTNLSESLSLFELIEAHEQVGFLIVLIQDRIALIDAALAAIKDIPTFPYPMTLPHHP